MRVLNPVRVASYDDVVSLKHLGPIEVTNAALTYAEALITAIEASGGTARLVNQYQDANTCVLTEALTDSAPAERHYRALQAILSTGADVRTIVLDHASSALLPDIGGVSGLCRSLRIEHPGARAYSVSVDTFGNIDAFASRVVRCLALSDGDYTAHEDGVWQDVPGKELFPPRFVNIELPTPPVWLVSGGGRGVTADCTIEIAKRTGGSFILLGRSDIVTWPDWLDHESDLKALRGELARNVSRPDTPKKPVEIDRYARALLAGAEIFATLQAIESTGAKAKYIQADIGDLSHLRPILARVAKEEGTITGLVHGAGVLSDGRTEALQMKDFEKVFDPKVSGLMNVLSCLEPHALRHIGLFSSASAVFGNEGQTNYAAANAWLNNVAVQLARTMPETQVKAFCWGPWQGGMVDDTLARMFIERGIGLIRRPEGARILADQLLLSPHDQIRFVVGDEWGGQ